MRVIEFSRKSGGVAGVVTGRVIAALLFVAPAVTMAQSSDAPQPDGYTYYWPGACVQAVQRSHDYYWRARQDTVAWTPAGDTALSDEKKAARECAEHFANASLTSYDLIPLAQLYLINGDEASARSVVERRLADPEVKEPGPRAWVLAQIVDAALSVSPKHLPFALSYLSQVDTLRGDDAAIGKVKSYLSLAEYYRDMGDDNAMVRASEKVIAAGRGLNTHDRNEFAGYMLNAYHYLAEAEGDRTGDSTAPLAVLGRARTDIGQLMGISGGLNELTSVFKLYGRPAARLVGTAWLGAPGDTIHPVSGKATLLNFVAYRWMFPAAGRMAKAFDGQLDVASVRPTIGYFKDLGPLSTKDEVGFLQKYFTDELHVPGAIAITATEFHQIPDGRRIPDPGPNNIAYVTDAGTSFVVVDKQGIIRRVWLYWNRSYEPRVEKTIAKYVH